MVTDQGDLSRKQLERMCPKLMDGLACINSLTVRCLTKDQRSYFNMLYDGTIQVVEYQKKLKQIQGNHSQDALSTTPDKKDQLCCSFQEYLACIKQVVSRTCGLHTATFTRRFLDRMAKPLANVSISKHI